MASSAPPILPVTTPQPPTTIASTTTATPATTTPALRPFITHLHDQIKDGFSQRRPWAELVDRSAFAKPESISDASTCPRKNCSYFRVNYLAIIGSVLAFSLLSHPFSLITLAALLAAWSFLYLFKASDQPLFLFGRGFSDKETLGLLVIFSVFVIFLTNVGSVIMSALIVGLAIVAVHGAFRVPEDLFLDDQDSVGASNSLLTFLGATTKKRSHFCGRGFRRESRLRIN